MLSHEDIKDFIEHQLTVWSLAKKNYDAIARIKRKNTKVDDLLVGIQWNPGRIGSTGAKIDVKTISERPCFLCRENRPQEQLIFPIAKGWEMLVNPFPIFPVHLTIVSETHRPQSSIPEDIVNMATELPGMAVFFNGAHAGASAPDHMHMQAVLKEEIPLIALTENYHSKSDFGIKFSSQFGLKLPFFFISGVVAPDESGMATLITGLKSGGLSDRGELTDSSLVNAFFWLDDSGILRFINIPRRSHRPSCYYLDGDNCRMVSPGSIDMGGIIIVPREQDFKSLTADEIRRIYSEVALTHI